jgi:hypothetical protein
MATEQITLSRGRYPWFEALFQGLIDYAGLFPPAALPLGESLANYLTYRRGADRWILGRFVLTTAHLAALSDDALTSVSPDAPLDLSLISRDPTQDFTAVVARLASTGGRLSLGALEVTLDLERDFAAQLAAHRAPIAALEVSGAPLPVFYELPFTEGWDARFNALADTIAAERSATGRPVGVKLRCGGLERHLVPEPARLAQALAVCGQRGIPNKFTAGLHHPFPRASTSRPGAVSYHGYLSVYVAAIAARSGTVAPTSLEYVLRGGDGAPPTSAPSGVQWCGLTLTNEAIRAARFSGTQSFGSCSFIEPLDDARAAGWL